MGMTGDTSASLIVRSTIDLAHSLGLSVTAEGVEDQATLDGLRALGCDAVQGFLLSRPPADDRIPGNQTPGPRYLRPTAGHSSHTATVPLPEL